MTAEGLARTIENPLTGERVTFLTTAEETNGEYVRIRNETSAGAGGWSCTTTSPTRRPSRCWKGP